MWPCLILLGLCFFMVYPVSLKAPNSCSAMHWDRWWCNIPPTINHGHLLYLNQITCKCYSEKGSVPTVTTITLKLSPQIEYGIPCEQFLDEIWSWMWTLNSISKLFSSWIAGSCTSEPRKVSIYPFRSHKINQEYTFSFWGH